jgi:hypothetical protein
LCFGTRASCSPNGDFVIGINVDESAILDVFVVCCLIRFNSFDDCPLAEPGSMRLHDFSLDVCPGVYFDIGTPEVFFVGITIGWIASDETALFRNPVQIRKAPSSTSNTVSD